MNWKRVFLTWLVVFGLLLLVFKWFSGNGDKKEELANADLALKTSKTEYAQDQTVSLILKNNTNQELTLPLSCPKNPFVIKKWVDNEFVEKNAQSKIPCENLASLTIKPNEKKTVSYSYWNHSLFGEIGRYKIEVPITIGSEKKVFQTNEFGVKEPGTLRLIWDKAFYQPLLNLLILFINTMPGKDLGIAIILLTILIRILLFIPSQRAIHSQQKMQQVQPKLEHIKKKYAGNQERIAKETMELWKKEKVSPFGSCLPLIIQFPVLIALYYVISNGLNPDNVYMLYGSLKNIDFPSIHTNFLGILELTKVNAWILPIAVGLLQFSQMKLATAKKISPGGGSGGGEMEMANKMMIYFMPIMIALFTASVPAGVGLYWGVSTVFGIVQQIFANRKVLKSAI